MRKIYLYVFSMFLKNTIYVQLFMAVIVMAVNLLQHSKLMGEYNVGFIVIFNYEAMILPYTLYLYMPISAIISVLFTMITLLKNNELLAYLTSGGRVRDLLYPLLALGILLSVMLVFMADVINPKTLIAREEYSSEHMQERTLKMNAKLEDVWMKDKEDRLVHINNIDPVNKQMFGIEQYYLNKDFEVYKMVKMEKAVPEDDKWQLINGEEFTFKKVPKLVDTFEQRTVKDILFSDLMDLPVFKPMYLSISELTKIKNILEEQNLNATNYYLQIYQKYAHSLSILVIILLIYPLSVNMSRHISYIKIASIALSFGIIFWLTMSSLYTLGKTGLFNPIVANFLSHVIFALIGIFLLYKKERQAS